MGDNLQKLADSHYDVLVIDQTRSLKGMEDYDSKADVTLLKSSANSSGGKKTVVAYMDVGEAESYRWYWQSGWRVGNPEWIVAPDPGGWDENYPVKFWRQEWKAIVQEYLDLIIEDGYDGVYLVGVGWSCVNVASSALIVDTTSTDERGRSIGAMDTFSTGSGTVLPLAGGAMAEFLGLPYVGVLGMVLMVVPFVLLLRLREYSPGQYGLTEKKRVDALKREQ